MLVWLVGSPASAGPLVLPASHWPFRLTGDALQAARACLAAEGLCSAETLVTASAAPHWPFRLTDDAPQAARACLAGQGFAFAGPLVISGQKHDTRDDSLATSFNMVAKCFTADALWPGAQLASM